MKTQQHNWPYFVIEGPDGCGKGTVVGAVNDWLTANLPRLTTVTVTEPSDGLIGQAIRQILRGEVPQLPAQQLQQLFVMDRQQHLANVADRLSAGDIVLSDRSALSTLVYGHTYTELGIDYFVDYHQAVFGDGFLAPRQTIVLVVTSAVALERMERRGGPVEATETRVPQVIAAYEEVIGHEAAQPLLGKVRLVFATGPVAEVIEQVRYTICQELKQLGLYQNVR